MSDAYVHVPDTVSREAQAFLRTLKNPALNPAFPEPTDIAGWKKVQAWAEADGRAKSEPLLKRYEGPQEDAGLPASMAGNVG
jgi:hypothetical protein